MLYLFYEIGTLLKEYFTLSFLFPRVLSFLLIFFIQGFPIKSFPIQTKPFLFFQTDSFTTCVSFMMSELSKLSIEKKKFTTFYCSGKFKGGSFVLLYKLLFFFYSFIKAERCGLK
jgi:hypothetical protein